MPVTLSEEWIAALGEDAQDVHGQLLHCVGNLTLTAYNSEMSNYSFVEKKKRLAQSHYELNKYFAAVTAWGKDQIQARSRALWEAAKLIWEAPGASVSPEIEPFVSEEIADGQTVKTWTQAAIALEGPFSTEAGSGPFTYYSFVDGRVIHFKYSKFHAKQGYYWYGINPSLIPDMEKSRCSHLGFILGRYGVACVPIGTVKEYSTSTGITRHSDGTVRHYHVLISKEPNVVMYWSSGTPRFPLGDYVKQFSAQGVTRTEEIDEE